MFSSEPSTPPPVPPLVTLMTDLVLKLILHTPAMQSKLGDVTHNVGQAYDTVRGIFDELTAKLTPHAIQQVTQYMAQQPNQANLMQVLQEGFGNILADGKIDVSDSVYFMSMIQHVVQEFETKRVSMSSSTVLCFLYFAVKAVLVLTLTGKDEEVAVALLNQSFNLLSLTVAASGVKCKCWA